LEGALRRLGGTGAARVSDWRSVKAAIAAVVVAGCLASCGGSSESADSGVSANTVGTGVPAVDDGPGTSNVGERRDRDRLLALFTGMQRDFQAGRMDAVCRHVSRKLLSRFPPGEEGWRGPCAARLARYARMREDRGASAPELTLVWVRVYDGLDIGGITVREAGERTRIPFVREQGLWKLELGVFERPDMLDGTTIRLTP
jgi:hypothetical protein